MVEQWKRLGGITNQRNARNESKSKGKKDEENENVML